MTDVPDFSDPAELFGDALAQSSGASALRHIALPHFIGDRRFEGVEGGPALINMALKALGNQPQLTMYVAEINEHEPSRNDTSAMPPGVRERFRFTSGGSEDSLKEASPERVLPAIGLGALVDWVPV